MLKKTLVLAGLMALASGAFAQSFFEGFDSVGGATSSSQAGGSQTSGANMVSNGWFFRNNSNPRGLIDWSQGNSSVFSSFAGAANSYIAANADNTGANGTISNWMLTPTRNLRNGDTISFYTRTVVPGVTPFPDRLQVRLSTAGASTEVGSTDTSVGDFTTLLLDINPNLTSTGFPSAWTQFTATVSGLAAPTDGRFAFRYFVTGGGFNGVNSNYIGIDSVQYSAVPEPMTLSILGLGALAAAARRRKNKKS